MLGNPLSLQHSVASSGARQQGKSEDSSAGQLTNYQTFPHYQSSERDRDGLWEMRGKNLRQATWLVNGN